MYVYRTEETTLFYSILFFFSPIFPAHFSFYGETIIGLRCGAYFPFEWGAFGE